MATFKRIGLVAAVVCAMTVSVGADQSTPKGAALAHGKALEAGDKDALRATTFGTEEEYKALDAMIMVVKATKKVSEAFASTFGEDNPVADQFKTTAIAEDADEYEVKEQDDTATIVHKARPDEKDPTKLIRKDDKWYVDLTGFPRNDHEKNLMRFAPALSKVATETAAKIKAGAYSEAQKQVAEEIKNGKYPTPEEAEAATAAAKGKDALKAYEAYQHDGASAMLRIVEEAEKQK